MALRCTSWTVDRPGLTADALGALGLLVRHGWLTSKPLSSGDWKWPTAGRLLEWFPWPSVWNDSLGLSGQNRFEDAFRFPVYALNGLVAELGASWTVIEKVVYFVPFAVLLPIAGWLLAREVLGATRWALLAPLLLLANTYFLVEPNGEIPLALSEAIGCLALVAVIKAMRQLSWTWALVTGLLMAASAAADVRPAYVTALMIAGYVMVLALSEPAKRLLTRRLVLVCGAGAVFVGSQAFWIVPLLTYKGHPSLPTAASPDYTILTLTHGIAGVMANWTGGPPAPFTEAPLDPMFIVVPLVAMALLVRRKMKPEVLWLALMALGFAFLAKTDNPPLGGVYDWLYSNFPGFNLFREGSKFIFPVAIGYAVLVPLAFASLREWAGRLRGRPRLALSLRSVAVGALVGVLALSGSTVAVLERGQLGSTTSGLTEPKAFTEITSLLASSRHEGPVLWFGSPVYVTGGQGEQRNHTFTITSASHPLYDLTGVGYSSVAQGQDVFQNFCPDLSLPYCYVDRSIFPYLARVVGASYIVSPASDDLGILPAGITRGWLHDRLSSMFGPPQLIGAGTTRLYLWSVEGAMPAVGTYGAVASVASGPWSLSEVLPAIEAMGLPAVYTQSFGEADYPAPRRALPDSVAVFPRVNGGCALPKADNVGVMAETSSAAIAVSGGGRTSSLPLLARSNRLVGWGVYGPLALRPGEPLLAVARGLALGPCIGWSALASGSFASGSQPVAAVHSQSNGERIVAASAAGHSGPWVELRRTYDPGWRLGGHAPIAVGDGLFNAYYRPDPAAAGKAGTKLTFTFSTLAWEHIGTALAAAVVIGSLAAIVVINRRRRRRSDEPAPQAELDSGLGPPIALVGLIFLGLTGVAVALEWFGIFSSTPSVAVTSNPYGLDILLGGVAVGLLAASLLARLAEATVARLLAHRVEALGGRASTQRRRRRTTAGAGVAAAILMVAGCSVATKSASQALNEATQAGATSPEAIGASLIDARNATEARNPGKCIADYTAGLHAFPDLATAYAGRARCYQSGGQNFAASVHDYTRALQLDPDNPLYLLGRAAGELGIGDVAAAVGDYKKAVSSPASTPADALAAIDEMLATETTVAVGPTLALAMSRHPADPLVWVAAADVAIADDSAAGAEDDLARAVSLASSLADPTKLMAALSRICGLEVSFHEYNQALSTCGQAASLAAGNSGAFDNLGAADAALGHLDSAISDLSAAIGAFDDDVSPNAQPAGIDGFGLSFLLEAQGRLYLEDHQPRAAVADYARSLAALPPGNPDFAARLHEDIKAARQPWAFG